MNSRYLLRVFRALFVIGLAAVAALSLLPHDSLPDIRIWDKWQHLAAYAALSFTGCGGASTRRGRWVVGFGVAAYGGALEIAQTFIPGRIGSLADLTANCLGVALGAGALWLFRKIRKAG